MLAAALAGWCGVAWGAVEPEVPDRAPDAEPDAEPDATKIRWAIVRVEGEQWQPVHDAIADRLPGVTLLPFDDAAFEQIGGDLFAYVEVVVEPGPEAKVDLTIVLSDQRAYLRSFRIEQARALRSIATTVAATIVAIEQEQLPADEQVAEIPRPEPTPEPEVIEPEPDVVEPQPEPIEPVPVIIEPTPASPTFELGVAAAIQPTFGLAPGKTQGLSALGGAARISVRHDQGFIVEAGLRVSGRARAAHRLWRNRLHLAAGYAWRRDRFALHAVAGPVLEPWTVRVDGVTTLAAPLGEASASPLWGATAAITPAWMFSVSPRVRLQLGLRSALAVSVLRSGAAGRVFGVAPDAAPDATAQVLFTFGGMELDTALELTVWISPPTKSR